MTKHDVAGATHPLNSDLQDPDESKAICRIGGHDVTILGRRDLGLRMVSDCRAAQMGDIRPKLVFDVNGQGVAMKERDLAYRAAVENADYIHADGAFLVFVSKLLTSSPIVERSATTDLIHDFANLAAQHGLSFYILGGEEGINRECSERLREKYPELKIAGRHHGFFKKEEERAIIEEIKSVRPDIVWVGLGKPYEQIFSLKLRDVLSCGWIITCGGCFNYVTGHYRRAPVWLQSVGLEWFFRAFTSPRLFKRYVTTNPLAIWIIMRDLAKSWKSRAT